MGVGTERKTLGPSGYMVDWTGPSTTGFRAAACARTKLSRRLKFASQLLNTHPFTCTYHASELVCACPGRQKTEQATEDRRRWGSRLVFTGPFQHLRVVKKRGRTHAHERREEGSGRNQKPSHGCDRRSSRTDTQKGSHQQIQEQDGRETWASTSFTKTGPLEGSTTRARSSMSTASL
jgi:hypothetical protein